MPAYVNFRDIPVCFRTAKVLVDGRELFVHLSNELGILKKLFYLNGEKAIIVCMQL